MEEHNKICTHPFVLDEKSKLETIQICRLLYTYTNIDLHEMGFRICTNFEAFLWNFSSSTNSKIVKSFCVSNGGGVEYKYIYLNINQNAYRQTLNIANKFFCVVQFIELEKKTHTQNWERISFFKKLIAAACAAAAMINIFYFWIVYWSNKNCNSPNFLQAEKFSSKDICQGLMAKWVPNRNIRFSGSRISLFNANWISNASLYRH